MANDLGETWRKDWRDYLEANLPASLAGVGCGVREATEEGERPQVCLVVAWQRTERVPSMDGTGRVHGVIAYREPHDLGTVEEQRARLRDLWGVLSSVAPKPGPLAGVFLHDLRWEDRESGEQDGDRITGWLLSSMATLYA